jgi:U3 small nucleolar RNA-associated protein 11
LPKRESSAQNIAGKKSMSEHLSELKEYETRRKLKELSARLERAKSLEKSQRELELQKLLRGKGKKYKVGTDSNGNPIYKWRQERKK